MTDQSMIRRRNLPNSLRYLAQKLTGTEPLSEAERAGIALTLNMLADELDPPRARCSYGAPEGDNEESAEIRAGWEHSQSCTRKTPR